MYKLATSSDGDARNPGGPKQIDLTPVNLAPGKARTWPYVLVGLFMVVSLFGGFGAWAYHAKLDGAVIADARFAVKSKSKTIRHLQGGVVSDILVGEGDRVKAGQILLTLDQTVDKANFKVIDNELAQLSAQHQRLQAELEGATRLTYQALPEDLAVDSKLQEIRTGQQALFLVRLESRNSEKDIRAKRIRKLNEEIVGIERQISSNNIQIGLIEKELVGLRVLEKRKLVSRNRLLGLEREAERLRGQTAALDISITRAANSIGEIELEAVQAARRFQEQVTEQMRAVEPRINS